MFDQKEIAEAADRLRRHYEAIKTCASYHGSPYFIGWGLMRSWNEDNLHRDKETLARVYLADQAEREARAVMPDCLAANERRRVMGVKANLRVSADMEDLIVAVQEAVEVATADQLSKIDALRLAIVAKEIRDKIHNAKKGGA